MKAKLKVSKRLEDGTIIRCVDQIVEFVGITGTKSANVIDSKGKHKRVLRNSLLDVPSHLLYPDIPIVGKSEPDPESWKAACYFD